MAVYELEDVSFTYAQGSGPVLSHLSFAVEEGEFLLLCGPSGGGKSTLLRLMKHLSAPRGILDGQILYQGRPVQEIPSKRLAGEVGFVLQNVDSQLVSDHVDRELAFGLENLGVSPAAIASKVAETAAFFGIERYFDRRTTELSGGEKQLLNLAGVMAADPRVLILDEPLSQLDPIARLDFLSQLRRVNQDLGVTVILSEHHLDEVYSLCDRVLVLEKGSASFCGNRQETAEFLIHTESEMVKALPASLRLAHRLGLPGEYPLDVRGARLALSRSGAPLHVQAAPKAEVGKSPVLSYKGLTFGYDRSRLVLSDLDLKLNEGECLGIIGGNGSGKSTLLHLLAGNLRPLSGKVKCLKGKIGFLPQNPYHSFIRDTLREDILLLLRCNGLDQTRLDEMLNSHPFFDGLKELMEKNPLDFSGGEAQRAALLKLLLAGGTILLLDEPSKGLDAPAREHLLKLLSDLKKRGNSFILVSHDLEFAARCADRCMMLFRGEAAAEGTPRELFCANHFYTTTVRKITRGLLEQAVLEEDVEAVRT